MTTLAIIGGGIAGRSLIYTLAKKKNSFSKIVLFDSDYFAPTCSLRSTAIVAPRGVTSGHSALGDLLVNAFSTFSSHVHADTPQGVFPITQYTTALTKLEQFKKRYPGGTMTSSCAPFSFKQEMYLAQEEGFLIDTKMYLTWLLEHRPAHLDIRQDFVTQIESSDRYDVKIQTGEVFHFDKVIMCGGSYNRFWSSFTDKKEVKLAQSIQGCFLEFSQVDLGPDSFSLTLEGDNFIYHAHTKKVLIGSTTHRLSHELPPHQELTEIYQRLSGQLNLSLPDLSRACILTGQREKSTQRKPYLLNEGNLWWMGGFYKNGYSLALHLSQQLVEKL